MRNNIRFDLSDYLIHFFRDVDLESSNYILFPQHAGFNNLNHSTKLDALFLMRCAIRHHKLCASWSYRNDKRTIYGKMPAVCFTDMPLAAFIQTSMERLRRGENIGQYALMLPKSDMFRVGARPVIYGLDSEYVQLEPSENDERVIKAHHLPLAEQYRYVTYNPNATRPIDWTHEREWRWPFKGSLENSNNELSEFGVYEDLETYPGLDFKMAGISGAGVVVHKECDINKVLYDILTLVDRNVINESTFKFIIASNKLSSHMDILSPKALSECINQNLIDLSVYFNVNQEHALLVKSEVGEIIQDVISQEIEIVDDYAYEYGKSWVWFVDNQPIEIRALISLGMLSTNKEGRYLLSIDNISYLSLRKQEKICRIIASRISKKYLLKCTYFSVRGKCDYDEVPFYTDFSDENHEFYNSTIYED